jgi:chromosome segregation ATPase
MGIEAGLQGAIDAINHAENGILAQAKAEDAALKQELEQDIADVNTAVGTEETRAKAEEAKLAERLVALEGVEGEDGKVTGGVLNEAKAYVDAREVQIRSDIQGVTNGLDGRLQTAEGEIDDAQEDILELQAFMKAVSAGDVEVNLGDVDNRIKALEALHQGDNSVEKQIEAAQNAANKAQGEVDALELVVGEKAAEGKAASGIFADIAALQADVDQNEVDCDNAIAAEVKNRQDADKALQDQLDAMNGKDGAQGSIAAAIKAAVDKEAEDRAAAVAGVQANLDAQLVEANEGTLANKIKANANAIAVLNGDKNQAGSVDKKIADAIANVNEAADDLEERVLANENAIKVINGEGEGSIKKAVADLVDGAPEALDTLNELAAALRDNAGVLDAVEQAFDNKLSAQKQALQKEIDDDVKVVADELAKQKNPAQEGSLAKQIADEVARAKAEEEDIRKDFAAADAALKQELQKEIDDDVKVVADALANEKDATKANSLAKQIADEVKARDEADKALDGRVKPLETHVNAQPAIDQEQNRRIKALEDANKDGGAMKEAVDAAQDAADAAQADVDAIEQRLDKEGGLVDRIEANEAFVAAQPAIDQEQDRRIKALEDANAEGGAVKDAIDAAQEAAEAAQADVDAVEKRLDDEGGLVDRLEAAEAFVAAQPDIDKKQNEDIEDHEERIAGLEAFKEAHNHSVMEQGIANNKAAIEKLNGGANVDGSVAKSIADALVPYSTTEEVKTILGNVVATLNLSMVNDKVVLKLGGAEGIALSEVSLNLATDADIDAIIAGLDA